MSEEAVLRLLSSIEKVFAFVSNFYIMSIISRGENSTAFIFINVSSLFLCGQSIRPFEGLFGLWVFDRHLT